MAENLNYKTPDGNSRCYPANGSINDSDEREGKCGTYGRLYNWTTAKSACPSGWHLPSDAEWTELTTAVSNSGTKLKAKSNLWNPNIGTDIFGFTALPGGYGSSEGPFEDEYNRFYNIDQAGYWWSDTEATETTSLPSAYYRIMNSSATDLHKNYVYNKTLYSVRCVKDD